MTTLLGAALMVALLVTTAFVHQFILTLILGLPFLAILSATCWIWYRRERPE